MQSIKMTRFAAVLLALAMSAAACGSSDDSAGGDVASGGGEISEATTIDYWLWDGNQQPFYEQCAVDFTANVQPNVTVNIEQFGWGGTPSKKYRRRPKVGSGGTETRRRVQGQKPA